MVIYTKTITPRLLYISDFWGNEIIGKPFLLTTDINFYREQDFAKINYSDDPVSDNEIWIKPHTLLFENNISEQLITTFEINGQKVFFRTAGHYPFDLFAASFYLLSRYEEYLPHSKDVYGRYAHENSLAYKEGFLEQPLINFWMQDFRKALKDTFPQLIIHPPTFVFLPSYDVDIAWSYKHKGIWRNAGGFLQSLLNADWRHVQKRLNVLLVRTKDPFDSYEWLNQLHDQVEVKPCYFFLVAEKRGKYDRNISPSHRSIRELIKDHSLKYDAGIHPSWNSGDDQSVLKSEIDLLQKITGNSILKSRQHYIRFTLPVTFRHLIESGIQFDYSMGYGSINGFRASVASPFFWYDLEKDNQTSLKLFPFCFMEANSYYEQKYSAEQALDEMRHYYDIVKSINGIMIMIWHNHFLGTDILYKGWREVYEQFILETCGANENQPAL